MARKQFTTEQALAAVLASSDEEDGGGVSEPEGFDSGDEDTYAARKDPFEDAVAAVPPSATFETVNPEVIFLGSTISDGNYDFALYSTQARR
ncbi:hypothetical protein EYF80_041211 [Liparis tanakae]|uniref:Uncharacterized protein n=1 Tax=Liparis tanakae TaxID=230148 RepID=A0A4Z2G7N8_9TELE|nr:hypothetical protein EYF80_041211 [Liparis tanakae]